MRRALKIAAAALIGYCVLVVLVMTVPEETSQSAGFALGYLIGIVIRYLWLPLIGLAVIWYVLRRQRASRP